MFGLIYYGWQTIGEYLGGFGVVFMASLFSLIIIRIFVSAVFKLFRMNINYYALQNKNKYHQAVDSKYGTPTLFDNVK